MSSEGYDTAEGLPPQPRRTIDDLVESMERATTALTQAMISPDEQQEFERFELISTGPTAIDQTISFIAREVRVDNFTNMHMEVTNSLVGQMWVPPGAVGFRIPLSGTRHIRIQAAAPPAITDPTWTAGTIAVFIFSKFPTHSVVIGDTLVAAGSTPPVVQITGDAGKSQTQAYSADALSQTLLGLITNARLQAWNPSTSVVDRLRVTSSGGSLLIAGGANGLGDSVANVALPDNAGVSRALAAANYGWTGTPASWDRLRTATTYKTFGPVAIAASSFTTVWTPASGKKPRLMGFLVNLVSTSTGPGMVGFYDNATSGTFMGGSGWMSVPSSLVSSVPHGLRLDNGAVVSASSNVIVAYSSVAITIAGMVFGTEE